MCVKNEGMKIFLFFILLNSIYSQENDIKNEIISRTITKSFGSFSIPNEWVEITRYSRNGKYFYSHQSESIGSNMTNISIEIGSNPYELDNHPSFRGAILMQMLMQAKTIGADFSPSHVGTTKGGYPFYGFTIDEKDKNITTTQFYICGNKKHILVHVTDFHNGNINNVEEIARLIVDSFSWPK